MDEVYLYPKGRKRGVVVRIQVDYSRKGRLLRYSLVLIDGRVLGYDNVHGHHYRHQGVHLINIAYVG